MPGMPGTSSSGSFSTFCCFFLGFLATDKGFGLAIVSGLATASGFAIVSGLEIAKGLASELALMVTDEEMEGDPMKDELLRTGTSSSKSIFELS